MKIASLSAISLALLLTACASDPGPRMALEKTVEVDGTVLKFNGSYHDKKNILILSVNGDPIMQGRFPPYTPTQNLKANYKDFAVKSHCYFGSVLGKQGGAFGAIAGIVQSSKSSTADKCELYVNEKLVDNLYF
ncbi:hypothetical protein L1D40_05885 [Shewanella insulae]|uniref:Lipoprotein n=1 Tax=Shewanella insulae TaxID=2681496 RepID=A0A6L7I0I4_9GAMM|nr:hypothetical protein [Shewanella insulae]MCG9712880.1 hypothetical protein [Shewanella insulae]MCG9754763.1 hypothetical protein [Shewanella insulae]MXR69790.1 hypothetical protein [Shewanella insulae]